MHQVKDICRRFSVTQATVINWIKSGELKAMNVGRGPGKKKPRWRITDSALADFERQRSTSKAPTPESKSRIRRDPAVIEFFK